MTLVPWMHRALHTTMPDYSGNWWWYFTYITNWKANFAAPDLYLGHFWSLAVEEQFYVVWPTVVLLLARRRLAWACAALIISATILRCVWSAQGVYWNQIYRLTVTRWDTMAMGALCALALRSESARNWAYRSAPILMAVGGSVFVTIAVKAGGPECREARYRPLDPQRRPSPSAAWCFTRLQEIRGDCMIACACASCCRWENTAISCT